uniref:arylamine N-acetyltransferase n=2 Tax=Biomphalaria glabrata TaxID=6526 RepID=A0A2C9M5Y5_BIOGL
MIDTSDRTITKIIQPFIFFKMATIDLFSRDEAFNFLKDNLNVKDVEQRLSMDRKNLLDDIATNMQIHLVFNNMRLLSLPQELRQRPSFDEIKSDLKSGIGGLCYNLNVAAYYLIKAIGFDAALAHGTCTSSTKFHDNHVFVYIRNVEKNGDVFLLEAGFGFPTFRVINLDFEKESPIYIDSFIEYKYIKHEGQILRMHRKGELVRGATCNTSDGVNFFLDGWRRFYFADPERFTNSIEEFYAPFDQVFQNPKASPFHLTFRAVGFPGKKAVMVINDKTLIENDQGELVSTPIEGGDEGILQAVHKYFPVIPQELSRAALANWRASLTS